MAEIYLKIYTENEGRTLVLEGQGDTEKKGYYPTGGGRIGTVVIGAEHISITADANEAFRKIILRAHRTGDDISCLDIHRTQRFDKEKGEWTEEGGDICVSYLGDFVTKLDIDAVIADEDFFIGCGEGAPDTKLLDELTAA